MPPTINVDQKARLLSASPFMGLLFDLEVLEAVITEHQDDAVADANVKLASSLASLPALLGRGQKRKARFLG